MTWHIDNRYYEVDLRIRYVHDRAQFLEHAREGAPAVVLVVDSAEVRQKRYGFARWLTPSTGHSTQQFSGLKYS